MRGRDGLVQFLQALELRGEAAFRRGVDHQHHFVAEVGEGIGLAFFWGRGRQADISVGFPCAKRGVGRLRAYCHGG